MRSGKRLFITVSMPFLAAILTIGVREAWSESAKNYPVLECPQALDLGDRERGEIVLCQFRVGNSGRDLLALDRFQTSCSCAGVEHLVDGRFVSVQSVKLDPGHQVELAVRVAIGAPYGESQEVHVMFQTNDPTRPVHDMQVIVPRVKGGVYAQPKAVLFGTIPAGAVAKRVVNLYDSGVRGRKVSTVRSMQPQRFAVRLVPLGEEERNSARATAGNLIARLEVTTQTSCRGPLDGEVEVTLANETRTPDLIPVLGEAVSEIVCRPPELFMPRRVGKEYVYDGEVLVASRDGTPIRVAVESLPPGMSPSVRKIAGRDDQALIRLQCEAPTPSLPRREPISRVRLRVLVGGKEMTEIVPVVFGENPT